jgi:hypothetical protein
MRCSEQRDKITKEKDRHGKQKRNRCFWNELLELWGIDRIPSTRILKRLFMASLFMQNMQNMQKIREETAAARSGVHCLNRSLASPRCNHTEGNDRGRRVVIFAIFFQNLMFPNVGFGEISDAIFA